MSDHAKTCNAYGVPRQRLAYCDCGASPNDAAPVVIREVSLVTHPLHPEWRVVSVDYGADA